MILKERASTHVYRQKRMFTKEELEAREHLCVHEQPAYCSAACPLKLDAKAMTQAIAQGNFDKALGLYEKITPLPHILSALCEAPCEGTCKLCSLGEGIALGELEAAAVSYGSRGKGRGLLRKKTKTVAIFGADLFTLFLAGELSKKMYPVTFYLSQSDAGALLRSCPRSPRGRRRMCPDWMSASSGTPSRRMVSGRRRKNTIWSALPLMFSEPFFRKIMRKKR